MAVINTNVASLNAQRNLSSSQSSLSVSLQRLSSGLRINSAKDDAAGLAISERFTAQIRGLNQAVRNASDGISLSQTAEGALGEVTNNLQRIRELAVQSANATNSASDRAALQQEVSQLVSEIDRVATETNFNGVKLLDGTFTSQTFQVGANVGETISVDSIASARSASLGTYQGFSLANQAIGTAGSTAAAAGVDIDGTSYSLGSIAIDAKAIADAINSSSVAGLTASADATSVTTASSGTGNAGGSVDVDINGQTITITSTANLTTNRANAVAAINAESSVTGVIATDTGAGVTLTAADGRNIAVSGYDASGAGSAAASTFGLAEATTGATVDVTYVAPDGTTGTVDFTGNAAGLGTGISIGSTGTALAAVDISDFSGANAAITAVDAALTSINGSRATLGAVQNRFESVVTSLQTTSENLSAARSRIMDADFAAETAALTRAQILQQAGTAMLSQANSLPQNVLALLQ
ncbi:MAG: flagellin [Halieaceae bacterium]|nr:flagellin [Halieaceae bacterium]